uniref:Putative secreted protein n=1 Tax=Anopheles marajoara TaxID=58244 RepID=A0A2M4CEP5_9DIPT
MFLAASIEQSTLLALTATTATATTTTTSCESENESKNHGHRATTTVGRPTIYHAPLNCDGARRAEVLS